MYRLTVKVRRLVEEEYHVELDASDPEEAADYAYEHFTEFPDSKFALKRRFLENSETKGVEVLEVEHQRHSQDD